MHHKSHDQVEGGLHPGGRGLKWWDWADPPSRTGKADGTHPTGMLSCFWYELDDKSKCTREEEITH